MRERSAKSTDLDLAEACFLILEYPFILCFENGEQMCSSCGSRDGSSRREPVGSMRKEVVIPRFGGKDIVFVPFLYRQCCLCFGARCSDVRFIRRDVNCRKLIVGGVRT